MLALVLSALITIYLIIPESIFRFTFGFFIPTRSFTLTGAEKAYRAVLVASIPFCLALSLCWYTPFVRQWPFPVEQNGVQQRRADYKVVAAAFYHEAEFAKSQSTFWPALTRCTRRQARLAFWYFFLIGVEGVLFGYLASEYARFRKFQVYRFLSDRLMSPYLSQWHPLLLTSRILPGTIVQADILCVNDVLYQGNVSEYFLKDGELSGIILKQPRRFGREAYLKAREGGAKPEKQEYWIPIPSRHLYFFADKIVNMNLTYIAEKPSPEAVEQFLAAQLPLESKLGKLSVSIKEGSHPMADELKTKLSANKPETKK